jgi:hypothetical protein
MAMIGAIVAGGPTAPDELFRSIDDYASAVRVDARVGVPAKSARLTLAPAGLAVTRAKRSDVYQWAEVRAVKLSRGAIVVKTEAPRERMVKRRDGGVQIRPYTEKRTRAVRVVVDGVAEPSLVPSFARILEDMRTAKFSYNGTSWIEYQNAHDHLKTEFEHQDDAVLPAAAGGLWLALGLLATTLIPPAINAANARAVPAGAFSISDHLGPLDPRSIIAGFALSALVATVVLRLAMGGIWSLWARGAARGWARRDSRRFVRLGVRQLGRILLASSSSAVIVLLALLSFWPNIAATVLVGPGGVRNEVLLPFISLEEPWSRTTSITREPGGVTIRFADGRTASTVGHELGGGTENQLIELTNQWWKAAR